jgi:hypothetical protein
MVSVQAFKSYLSPFPQTCGASARAGQQNRVGAFFILEIDHPPGSSTYLSLSIPDPCRSLQHPATHLALLYSLISVCFRLEDSCFVY